MSSLILFGRMETWLSKDTPLIHFHVSVLCWLTSADESPWQDSMSVRPCFATFDSRLSIWTFPCLDNGVGACQGMSNMAGHIPVCWHSKLRARAFDLGMNSLWTLCPRYNTPTSEQLSKWVLSYQCYISTRTTQTMVSSKHSVSENREHTIKQGSCIHQSCLTVRPILTMVENHHTIISRHFTWQAPTTSIM